MREVVYMRWSMAMRTFLSPLSLFPTTAKAPIGMQISKLLCRHRHVIYTSKSTCISGL